MADGTSSTPREEAGEHSVSASETAKERGAPRKEEAENLEKLTDHVDEQQISLNQYNVEALKQVRNVMFSLLSLPTRKRRAVSRRKPYIQYEIDFEGITRLVHVWYTLQALAEFAKQEQELEAQRRKR